MELILSYLGQIQILISMHQNHGLLELEEVLELFPEIFFKLLFSHKTLSLTKILWSDKVSGYGGCTVYKTDKKQVAPGWLCHECVCM